MWNMQLSNWLISIAGSGATFIAFVIFALFVFFIVRRLRLIHKTPADENQSNFRVLAGQLIAFGFVLTVMFSFQSNAPKYQLEVEEKTPNQASSESLPELNDLSPEKLTAEESSKRLELLREEQKNDSSVDKKVDEKEGGN